MKNQKKDEIVEKLNFEKPDFVFLPKGKHTWRQRGYYLVCVSCELQHAVFIGKDLIMVGEDKNGEPILKKRKDEYC